MVKVHVWSKANAIDTGFVRYAQGLVAENPMRQTQRQDDCTHERSIGAQKAKKKPEVSHGKVKKNKGKSIRRGSRNARSSRKHTLDSQESEALRTGREGSNVEGSGVLESEKK